MGEELVAFDPVFKGDLPAQPLRLRAKKLARQVRRTKLRSVVASCVLRDVVRIAAAQAFCAAHVVFCGIDCMETPSSVLLEAIVKLFSLK